jgi:arabinogalactan oligomer/maltooligosaccharide transport system substrate-binding protein
MNGLFTQGKVGVVVSGPWSVQSYSQALGADLGVAPMPALDNGVIPPTFTGVKGWMLSAFSKNNYWATELMKWMSSADASKFNYEKIGDIPPRPDIMETDLITGNPLVNGFAEQIKHGELTPNVPAMAQVWAGTAEAMTFTVQGKDPKTLWDSAVKKVKDGIAMQQQQKK